MSIIINKWLTFITAHNLNSVTHKRKPSLLITYYKISDYLGIFAFTYIAIIIALLEFTLKLQKQQMFV